MNFEKSCGAIIVNDKKVLLIKQISGDWGFPKGHTELGEEEWETAKREVKEETNLDVIINTTKRYVITYKPKENIIKDAVYFLASLKGSNLVVLQEDEVCDYEWVDIDKVNTKLIFNNLKEMWNEVLMDIE